MKNELEFKMVVAANLTMYRKASGLTQLELAEKLNYSDKAISKWERGESLPDLYVLHTIANMFGITLNDLVTPAVKPVQNINKLNKLVILMLSIVLTWLVAIVVFALLKIFEVEMVWMPFIYAIPVSAIVSIVFSKLWKYRKMLFLSISLLYYTIPLTVCMQLRWHYNMYVLFFVAIPLQALTILWFVRKKH
jgi:transcriptional regulator with XRE-family HTH domain